MHCSGAHLPVVVATGAMVGMQDLQCIAMSDARAAARPWFVPTHLLQMHGLVPAAAALAAVAAALVRVGCPL